MATKEQIALDADMSYKVPAKISKPLEDLYNTAYQEFTRKGGVRDRKAALMLIEKPFKTALGAGMVAVAEEAWRLAGGKASEALAMFRGACTQLESRIKSANDGESILKILPSWSPTKTPVVKFLQSGKDLFATEMVDGEPKRLYQTITDLRKNGTKARAEESAAKAKNVTVGETAVQMTAQLASAYGAFAKEAGKATEEVQDEIANKIYALVTELADIRLRAANQEANVQPGAAEEAKPDAAAVPAVSANAARREAQKRGGSRAAA